TIPPVMALMEEMRSGISTYLGAADTILRPGGVDLKPAPDDYFSMEKNFFSMLFLYSFHRAGISRSHRRLYAATLQCLRGMVTGCDNLLDDEYKKTLDTDIPDTGTRFRSVVDIMVSDRVLFQILLDARKRGEITMAQVRAALAVSMKTMIRSGVQEAAEEDGISAILKPDEILTAIHHYKTGILFQCPWDIPRVIETLDPADTRPLLTGLYRIGLGCQVLDDLVDIGSDLERRRHNFLVSLIHHGPFPDEKNRLGEWMASNEPPVAVDPAVDFPGAVREAARISRRFMEDGFTLLLSDSSRFLAEPFIHFLHKRIGADSLIPGPES
ncbi:MAG: hypothetical protein DSY90_15275, partial [Deltaproteobacteria bacterium]